MKKCASCTKDLPDAALHCVFCGAKQAPAPAVSAAANAKTVMGYGGQELEALRAQAAAANAARPAPANLPSAAPYSAPQPGYAPPSSDAATVLVPSDPPRPNSPSSGYGGAPRPNSPSSGYGGAQGSGGYNPQPNAGGYGAPAGGYSPPGGGYNPQPVGGYNPQPVQPIAPLQQAQPPYLASQTAARAGRPIEPWKDSLRIVMFVWGALLLAAFIAPLSLDPLKFGWEAIIHGEGKAKLVPLITAAVGVLSIVLGSLSLPSPTRGVLAAVLGLAGIFVPMLIDGMPPWQGLVGAVGVVLLVSSLHVRHEYRDASLARILVTVGVVMTLVPYVVPVGGNIPLKGLFQAVLDAEGQRKIVALTLVLFPVVALLGLLAWLPSPSSGAAKPIAWILTLWGVAVTGAWMFLDGGVDPTKVPADALTWVVGGKIGIGAGFLAIAGYGIATLIGKQLE